MVYEHSLGRVDIKRFVDVQDGPAAGAREVEHGREQNRGQEEETAPPGEG
jgi:hypothetical protein